MEGVSESVGKLVDENLCFAQAGSVVPHELQQCAGRPAQAMFTCCSTDAAGADPGNVRHFPVMTFSCDHICSCDNHIICRCLLRGQRGRTKLPCYHCVLLLISIVTVYSGG